MEKLRIKELAIVILVVIVVSLATIINAREVAKMLKVEISSLKGVISAPMCSAVKVGDGDDRFVVVDAENRQVILFEIRWDGTNARIIELSRTKW